MLGKRMFPQHDKIFQSIDMQRGCAFRNIGFGVDFLFLRFKRREWPGMVGNYHRSSMAHCFIQDLQQQRQQGQPSNISDGQKAAERGANGLTASVRSFVTRITAFSVGRSLKLSTSTPTLSQDCRCFSHMRWSSVRQVESY